MRYRELSGPAVPSLLLAVAVLLLSGCGPPTVVQCEPTSRCDRWGELQEQDREDLERSRWRNRTRWKLNLGLGMVSAGLVGTGVGTAYVLLATDREDDAAVQTERRIAEAMLDEAQDQRTVGAVALAASIPLIVAGLVFVVVDAAEPEPDFGASHPSSSGVRLAPVVTGARGPAAGVSAEWAF